MDKNFINLVEEVNSYSIDDIKDKIRNKIHKEIEKNRKDDEFLKQLELLEYNYWLKISCNTNNSNLKDLVKIYDSLKTIKFGIDCFIEEVNKN